LAVGGSTSGSAAAVAAGLATIGLGTDVAGSIRVPAAYCGIVGLRPVPGSIPIEGALPIVPSFDQVGILARSVADVVVAYHTLADREARTTRNDRPKTVGLIVDLVETADRAVAGACRDAAALVQSEGIRVEEVELRWEPRGLGRIFAVELSRTWGPAIDETPDAYTAAIRSSLAFGREQSDAAYRESLENLEHERARVRSTLTRYDAVLCPTVPHVVPEVADELSIAESTRYTRIINALGLGALSLPWSDDEQGRPLSVQLAGETPAVLDIAVRLETLIAGTR
jgi:Asp-tRNA(Asn)/Glu-tRNA(Gln) amidotransferase A subunit family amidase